MNDHDIAGLARGIQEQCRQEYPGCYDEAVSDMCEAVIFAEGLKGRDAQRLRDFCGL